jgi:hypothetical protein
MIDRFCLRALLLAVLTLPIASCTTTGSLTSIVISPSTVSVGLAGFGYAQGQQQYTAIGYYGHSGHQVTKDITKDVTWSSSFDQVATIVTGGTNAGLATTTGWVNNEAWYGASTITANAPGFNGDIVSNTATYTVTVSSSTSAADVISITVTPNPFTFTSTGAPPQQFVATGTTSGGMNETLTTTSGIAWTSSNPSVVTVGANSGIVTSVGSGTATVTATFTNSDNTKTAGNASVTVQ